MSKHSNHLGDKKSNPGLIMNWVKLVELDNKMGKSKADFTELSINDNEQFDRSAKKTYSQRWVKCILGTVGLGIFLYFTVLQKPLPPVVITPLGTIKGSYNISHGGRKFEAYVGIPYALPPIGKRRFEVPEPVLPWTDVLLATSFKSSCIQYGPVPTRQYALEGINVSEDCLFLNVYTPHRDDRKKKLLPVIFFIHGGAFRSGAGTKYAPDYLLDRDVVLVTINYRLGPLGFLSTENDVVPGNMGLKDQIMALRWVQDNIRFFGGDPKSVTLVGHSAGGVSVHLHYFTKITVGLFHRGISLSGTAMDCWGQMEGALQKAQKVAAMVGCSNENIREMVDCMKTKPAAAIVNASSVFSPWFYNPFSPFGPVVEKKGGEFPYMHRSPIDVINANDLQDLPWITGVVSQEGLFPAALFLERDEPLKDLNENWDAHAPHLLDYNYTIPISRRENVSEIIRAHYLGKWPINNSTTVPIVGMISDRLYAYNAAIAARLQAKKTHSPVRFYYFSYRGKYSFSDVWIPSKKNYGVSHGDDLAYVLRSFFDATTTMDDTKMHDTLLDFWVSFATDGTPNMGVDWPKLNPFRTELPFLHIEGPNQFKTKNHINFGQEKFWLSLGFKENIIESTILDNEHRFLNTLPAVINITANEKYRPIAIKDDEINVL